jgi:hypothetical protein
MFSAFLEQHTQQQEQQAQDAAERAASSQLIPAGVDPDSETVMVDVEEPAPEAAPAVTPTEYRLRTAEALVEKLKQKAAKDNCKIRYTGVGAVKMLSVIRNVCRCF